MTKIKLFLSLFICFSLISLSAWAYSYDITIPVKGKTQASEELQKNSLFTIYSFALRVAEQSCQEFSIANTRVSKPKKNGEWEEIWTINACKRVVDVPVNFTDKTYTVNPMGVKYISK